ncbi:PD-(D/E)XK nuclease family protein [Ancylomarina longa]|uniref:PD-(D/E)XK nuclease family protein n=1 Tax=Ancylomarina longa TaxID=2487017 RepID=A0A434AYB9_9BACT|nr:PD-(D/E)XK nuclease family protein [Ancylomarina longa]RUT79563.1 hypothetical protein DLK05_02410 [Ancylomarina longa]
MGETEGYLHLLKTLEEYLRVYNIEQSKIPLHINLVEEIAPNENAHSRILAQLFRISEKNLESFFRYLGGEYKKIDVTDYTIECEKHRIDISIKTKNGDGIIIENKICGASDQGEQIEKYIKKLEARGVKKDRIYVLYLTNKGGSPSRNSLTEETENQLGDRYRLINYRDNILPWLKYELLPSCHYKDKAMIGAIEHYINFLEIRFRTLDTYEDMNNELENILLNEFKLNDNNLNENLKIISTKIEEINQLSTSAERLQHNFIEQIFEGWQSQIKNEYKSRIRCNVKEANSYFFLSILFDYKDKDFACSIGKDQIGDQQYYVGISVRGTKEETKFEEISELCRMVFSKTGSSKRWYVWKSIDFDDVYIEFVKILEAIESKSTTINIRNAG